MTLASNDQHLPSQLAIATRALELMPHGEPNYASLIECSSLKEIIKSIGLPEIQTLVMTLVKNFCHSLNLVRNMSQSQVIACTLYLVDECRDFRMEDYLIMFTMAERGKLGDVFDHMDIEVIGTIHQEYLRHRQAAFKIINDNEKKAKPDQYIPISEEESQKRSSIIKQITKEIVQNFTNPKDDIFKERDRKIKEHQDMLRQQIIDIVEYDGEMGIAPIKEYREYYLKFKTKKETK